MRACWIGAFLCLCPTGLIPKLSSQNGGDAIEGIELVVSYNVNSSTAAMQAFREQYLDRFGYQPNFAAGQGYEAMLILAKALKATSGSAKGVPEALRAIQNFPVLSGKVSIRIPTAILPAAVSICCGWKKVYSETAAEYPALLQAAGNDSPTPKTGGVMTEHSDLRPSPIAGRWYRGNPQRLAQQVDDYLLAARLPELDGEVVAVIAPHAGHIYSGSTAGYAFKAVQGKSYDLVVVLSPLHSYASAALLTSAHWGYTTPLGNIPIDRGAVHQLAQNLTHEMLVEIANDQEHSLEIELPFLQRALASQFQLLPVMVRSQDPGVSLRLARGLLRVLEGRNALLVGSTDLSHFYPLAIAEIIGRGNAAPVGSFLA